MRKFTTLFLLALAMTVGANQAFAQAAAGPNDNGKPDRNDRAERDDDSDGGDGGDRISPILRLTVIGPRCPNDLRCPPRKPKLVKKETDDCSCVNKVMRVNGRFMPFIDCYNTVEINGRPQLRYCKQ